MIRTFALVLACALSAACDDGVGTARDLSFPFDLQLPSATGSDGGIGCAAAACSLAEGAICCWEPTSSYCAPQEACSTGIVAACDGPEDCAGDVCCQSGGSAASPVLCQTQCSGTIICHDDGDCPTASPHCCVTVAGPTGYHGCAIQC